MCYRKQADTKRTIRMKRKHESNNGMVSNAPNRSITPSGKTTITNLVNPHSSNTEVVLQTDHKCTRALQCDISPATCEANLMTDMDLLGPCEPGTSVVLEGIVWTESNNGILVVNVTWRGKTYVGTLMDATRHHWAPPRYREDSPVMDLDWKTPKYRNGRNANNSNNESSAGEGRRLRKCRRNNNNNNNNNNNSTINSLRSQTRQSPVFDLNTNRRRSRTSIDQQFLSEENPIPSKKSKDAKHDSDSQTIWECNQGSCGKKYKHATGLKYHQTHVHKKLPSVVVNGNVVEELKENSPSVVSKEAVTNGNKKTKKTSRNGTPELKSESASPIMEIENAFANVPQNAKIDSKNLSEQDKLTPKLMIPKPEMCPSPSASEANDAPEVVTRSIKKTKILDDNSKNFDIKPDINKINTNNSAETSSGSSTESRTDLVFSPTNHDEDIKPVNFTEIPRSPNVPSSNVQSGQEVPLNCKTSVVPENLIKTEATTFKPHIKQEPRSQFESDKSVSFVNKDSNWRERIPPLLPQTPQATYPSYGFGIDPMYHMQLMTTSPEYRNQIERFMAEQHYRQMYGRFDVERHQQMEAKPVDMSFKSSHHNSSQDQSKSHKKVDPQTKRPVSSVNQSPGSTNCPDKKIHSGKKMPPPTPPTTPQEDKKKSSAFKVERPDSRHQESSPGQPLRGTPRSVHKEPNLTMFPQGYPYPHPISKLPFELQPNIHGSPFLDPAATQVGLSRPPSYLDQRLVPDMSNTKSEMIKTPSGKRSVETSDELHKETPSKDKSLPTPTSLGGHNSPLTLRHLHTHHHTHVLGPAYSLYSSYNGLVPPVPQLVPPVGPVMPQSFIPK